MKNLKFFTILALALAIPTLASASNARIDVPNPISGVENAPCVESHLTSYTDVNKAEQALCIPVYADIDRTLILTKPLPRLE